MNKLNVNYVYAGKISERTGITDFISNLLNYPGFSGSIHVCGSGDDLVINRLKCLIAKYPNVIYHGLLDKEKLNEIYLKCDIGIIPYPNHLDFRMALPNKFYEYLSVGLHIGHGGLYSITNNQLIQSSGLAFNVFTDELQSPSFSPNALLEKFNESYQDAQCNVIRYL